jgi:hypothetical protein
MYQPGAKQENFSFRSRIASSLYVAEPPDRW